MQSRRNVPRQNPARQFGKESACARLGRCIVNASVRVFETYATVYASAGLPVFPVDPQTKRPAVRGWRNASPQKSLRWASLPRLGDADGLGLLLGEATGVTEIDVDSNCSAWLERAVEMFGETPIKIRTANDHWKLWYRHNREKRYIRPSRSMPIDILGSGFTIVPPSWREDRGSAYEFISGTLDDIASLPTLGAQLEALCSTPEAVGIGERNNALWRYCMTQARHCDNINTLIGRAVVWADAYSDPLSASEIERCARSAWKYERTGRNYLGLRRPQVADKDRIMDELLDQPDAYTLLEFLARWHANRPSFAIAPTAMSAAGSPPWPRRRIERARDVLVERGFLEVLAQPDRRNRKAGEYRLLRLLGRIANDHSTPSPR